MLLLNVFENIDSSNLFRVTIGYTAKAKTTNVILSHEHIDFKWVTPEEFTQLEIKELTKKSSEVLIGSRIKFKVKDEKEVPFLDDQPHDVDVPSSPRPKR